MLNLARPIVFLVGLSLAACGSLEGSGTQPYWLKAATPAAAPRQFSPLESMIAYHGYAWSLSGAEWAKENARLRVAVATRDAEETLCVRQALLAAAASAPAHERAQASGLFEQCERELRRRDSQLSGLVALLRMEFAERARLEERQRDTARRADELAEKLDELRAIEKTLLERNQPARQPRRP